MGKQIRIYLADGSVFGIRHGEITNWTGQALACPRSRFQDLREWTEVKRPGVYFLFGTDEETGEEAVYIGEAEVVLERLNSHFSGKDFWTELVAFTSKDDNLTKAHVRFLESRLVQIASAAGRYLIKNTASPQLPALPRADRDAMEEYLDATRTLLGVLGHRVLEPLVAKPTPTRSVADSNLAATQPEQVFAESTETLPVTINPVFRLHISNIVANAIRTDEGIVVLAQSQAAGSAKGSLSPGYLALRNKLIQSDALIPSGSKLVLTRDHLFKSPSQAAAVLVGYSINGRDAWRLPDGTTYTAYETRISENMLKELSELNNG